MKKQTSQEPKLPRNYQKPQLSTRGTVERVTRAEPGEGKPEGLDEAIVWGDVVTTEN